MFENVSVKEVLKKLDSNLNGLSTNKVKFKQRKYGKNVIEKEKKISKVLLFLSQFKNFLVIILILATLISVFIGHYIDALVIFIIVLINALLGFVQEYKAEKTLQALKKMQSYVARVLRDGKEILINSEELVPGDIVKIEAGNKIPADIRLIEVHELEIDESLLTGESLPVQKTDKTLKKEIPINEQKNIIFSGTIAVKGTALGVVINTGLKTEIGKISTSLKQKEEMTPLNKEISKLGKVLGISVIGIVILLFLLGIYQGREIIETVLIAISLGVAAIPEGLPAVITIILAIGVQRMAKINALVRKLSAVETLGSVNVICSDKTGTFTHNEMTVQKLFLNNKFMDVSGRGYDAKGDITQTGKKVNKNEISKLVEIGVLCNDSTLELGDPTERALYVLAVKAGIEVDKKLISREPFSSEKQYMKVTFKQGGKIISYLKGAPEKIIKMCDYVEEKSKLKKIDKKYFNKINDQLTGIGLRTLAMAYIDGYKFVLVGLVGMIDPARKEAVESVKVAYEAGIKVVMITGDHKLTAKAVAQEIGLYGQVVEGKDIDNMPDKEILETTIFARTLPEQKVRILEAYKKKGYIVAMTGDGVNDAPAIKQADIGLAMGSGTDVAKEASRMVLLDDNFATIEKAVREGRGIYENLKKFIYYLLSSNLAELMIISFAFFLKFPLPLLAIHILWVNLVTDGFPALALGLEKYDYDLMKKKPRPKNQKIVNKKSFIKLFGLALIITIGTLALFYFSNTSLIRKQTMAFTTLVMFQIFNSFNFRSDHPVYKKGFFSNKYLVYAILVSLGLQFLVLYTPLNSFFHTTMLNIKDWLIILAISITVFVIPEGIKILKKK